MEILKAVNIKKVFKTEEADIEVLKGINLSIKKGDMIAIMGPSGSGKSTLLQILGTIDKPTSGKVFIKDKDVFSLPEKELAKLRNKEIGFIFQFHNLLPEFTAIENVILPALLAGDSEKVAYEKAYNLLEKLGLEHRINHKPSQLSGGQQQRVAIARAIINNPSIILADEPTGSLDSENSEKVMQILRKLNQEEKISIIIATHDITVANHCNKIFYMKDGKILEEEK